MKSILLMILFLSSVVYGQVLAKFDSTFNDRYKLFEYLMGNYPNNSATTLPDSNMNVNISTLVYNVFGITDNEVLEMNGWVKVQWYDPKLTWDPEKWSGIDKVIIPAENVWKPDIGISNAKSYECKDFKDKERMSVEARSNGIVSYYGYYMSETPCPINTALFPFDEQVCTVIFGTVYSNVMDFHINLVNASVKDYKKAHVGQWKLALFVYYDDLIGTTYDDNHQEIHLLLVLERKPLYHIVLIILPFLLISVVASIIFLVEDTGMRFGISLTILLAKSVYIMIVSQSAPRSMVNLSVLDKFLLIQISLLVILTFIIVLGPHEYAAKEEGDIAPLIIRGIGHRIRKMKVFKWNRACDYFWLGCYIAGSIINCVVCLVIVPKTASYFQDNDNWKYLIPADK